MEKLQKILTLAILGTAVVAPAVYAADIDVSGFIDMSVTDSDTGTSAGLDQFEVNLGYDFGESLTATVDIEYQDNGSGEEFDLEQAFISYAVSDSVSVKAGRFLSRSGWETEEPTGLFQYSGTGYAKYFYGGYQQGTSVLVNGGMVDFGLSIVNDLGDLEGETRSGKPATETMVALNVSDAVTVKGFYMEDGSTEMVNIWGAYSADGLTLAAEFNDSENTPAAGEGSEAEGYLLMANYAWDKYGVTLRYHESEVTGTKPEDLSAITLASSYAVTDDLLLVVEYRADDDDLNGGSSNTFAVEALLTF
jgi:hypothetical protein